MIACSVWIKLRTAPIFSMSIAFIFRKATKNMTLSETLTAFSEAASLGVAHIAYCRGFIENYNFIRSAIRKGWAQIIPFLFVGKLHVDDVPLLYRKHLEGIVDPPSLLPPHFQDLNGLAVWMAFSNFLNKVDLDKVQGHYDNLFRKFL
jgi:hypothetical protein